MGRGPRLACTLAIRSGHCDDSTALHLLPPRWRDRPLPQKRTPYALLRKPEMRASPRRLEAHDDYPYTRGLDGRLDGLLPQVDKSSKRGRWFTSMETGVP